MLTEKIEAHESHSNKAINVSVVIPCYNGAAFLRETLESVLQQTHRPQEVIVVDDGSTDNSVSIGKSFGSVVKVIQQENQGESVARNRGMDEAHGAWIAFLDADDLWRPLKTERQLAIADRQTVAVCTATHYFSRDMPLDKSNSIWIPDPSQLNSRFVLTSGSPFHISSLIVRRSLPVRFPVWTQDAEDAIFIMECFRQGDVKIVPEPLTDYRRHPHNQSRGNDATVRWFESFEEWIERQRGSASAEQISDWRQDVLLLVTNAVTHAFWKRDWQLYRHMHRYMIRRSGPRLARVPAKEISSPRLQAER